jgi:tetraacyldisaccharide 4'-kinase
MREPHFWRDLDPRSRPSAPATRFALTPLSMLYAWAGKRRIEKAHPEDVGVPIICVGNLTLGGAGKTPVSAEIRQRLAKSGMRVATLSRGYGGSEAGPLQVDPGKHISKDVGDEPLMLSGSGESWIARDRVAGAKAMRAAGVQAIVMDDGHQNPALRKALSLLVIDAAEPFGNRSVFPKGPLREPVKRGLDRADGVILMGEGILPRELGSWGKPVLWARLTPTAQLSPGRYVAFAGIGRPQRFFDSLVQLPGITLEESIPYPDHHAYMASDFAYLNRLAADRGAQLVTTEKDYVRLPPDMRVRVSVSRVTADFDNPAALDVLLSCALEKRP